MFLSAIVFGVAAVGGYLYAIRPNSGREERMRPFQERFIAHRGLFDNKSEAPENSMAAFKKAVEAGYGIELDVQLTTDGKLVVFHDGNMKRICGVKKRVVDCSYEEVERYPLAHSQERIPLFRDVMDMIGGRVPVIIEVKPDGDHIGAVKQVCRYLKNYQGIYCIESFHPSVLHWLKKHHPDIIRGQLSSDFIHDPVDKYWIGRFGMANLLIDFYGKPDFIAYNFKFARQRSYRLIRKLYTVVNVAWTVRSQEELEEARKTFSVFIFDSFIPNENKETL